jgi:hypothetical protein
MLAANNTLLALERPPNVPLEPTKKITVGLSVAPRFAHSVVVYCPPFWDAISGFLFFS